MELHCNGRLWPFFKHRTWLEKPAKDKHPSLLRTLVDFVLKSFITFGPDVLWTSSHVPRLVNFKEKVPTQGMSPRLPVNVEIFVNLKS